VSLELRLKALAEELGADVKALSNDKVGFTDDRLKSNCVVVPYTTVVPSRPTLPAGYYVVWQGTADPAVNALPGDEWHPV
jgi:hypothetical protein